MGARSARAAKAACALGLSCALAAGALAAGSAKAVESVEASVPVTFTADGQVSATVPARVVCAVSPDGTLVCPDGTSLRVVNASAFPIHVSSVEIAPAEAFTVVSEGDLAGKRDAIAAAFESGGAAIEAADAVGAALSVESGFSATSGGTMPVEMTGAVSALDVVLTADAAAAFDVVWTVAPGERG